MGEHRTIFEIMNLGLEIILAVQLFSSGYTAKYVFSLAENLS